MSIKDIYKKIKSRDTLWILNIVLLCLLVYGAYKVMVWPNGGEVTINPLIIPAVSADKAPEEDEHFLVASKTGKKYHFPVCSGAKRIAEKNKIWFSSYEEAQKSGYTPATNCPGLK